MCGGEGLLCPHHFASHCSSFTYEEARDISIPRGKADEWFIANQKPIIFNVFFIGNYLLYIGWLGRWDGSNHFNSLSQFFFFFIYSQEAFNLKYEYIIHFFFLLQNYIFVLKRVYEVNFYKIK